MKRFPAAGTLVCGGIFWLTKGSWAYYGGNVNQFTFTAPSCVYQDIRSCIEYCTADFSRRQDMSDDPKERIIEWVKQQKKSKHYFNDLCKAVPEIKMMQAKKIVNELVNEGRLKYWSSGSTTMYMLPSEGDVEKEEKGMN